MFQAIFLEARSEECSTIQPQKFLDPRSWYWFGARLPKYLKRNRMCVVTMVRLGIGKICGMFCLFHCCSSRGMYIFNGIYCRIGYKFYHLC